MTIENEGWEVMNFGANMPLYALAEEVLHHTPAVVCLCATVLIDIERSARDYKEFREKICKSKIPVVLGGRAFLDENVRRRFSAELYAQSFAELAAFVRPAQDFSARTRQTHQAFGGRHRNLRRARQHAFARQRFFHLRATKSLPIATSSKKPRASKFI
jgi:cobalamin-dependent methionine synthase I